MRNVMAHELVAATAKEMAAAIYEHNAKDNAWYRDNPSQADFVERVHGSILTQARAALAASLESVALDEAQKELIMEALVMDNQLPRARTETMNELSKDISAEAQSRARH